MYDGLDVIVRAFRNDAHQHMKILGVKQVEQQADRFHNFAASIVRSASVPLHSQICWWILVFFVV